LKNEKIGVDATIQPYALEVIERLSARGETIVLQMDQSHINGVNEVLMLSVRIRKRALPVAWRVRSTEANVYRERQALTLAISVLACRKTSWTVSRRGCLKG